jgi:hypothetical protein
VDASDPDIGDTLTFSLDLAPSGMSINATTGLIEWTPTGADLDDHSVTVKVEDSGAPQLSATQSFTVTVLEVNDPPTINSSAVPTATQDALYTYDVDAIDPNAGDTLTFSLDVAPSGMTVDPASGEIQWTPTNAQVGSNDVTVRVEDTGGLFDTQIFSINVINVNDPPTIISTPVTTGTEGTPYTYDVDASDPDAGDTLTFSLDAAPSGMTINASSGLIQWTPTSGDHPVTVKVEDSGGPQLSATQSFTVTVAPLSATKFFVVDSGVDGTFEYQADGTPMENYGLAAGNIDPRGATPSSTVTAGSRFFRLFLD